MGRRTLVICEKPSSARRVAEALDEEGAPEGHRERGVPYFFSRNGGSELIVVTALGHLFSVAQDGGTWTYPCYDYRWVPAYEVDKGSRATRNFIDVIGRLSEGVDGYVSACDLDMEGSLIAYMILLKICGEESLEASGRMRFSTMTESDLRKAWEERSPSLDFPIIEAGRSRHEVDWLFGINLSRALTLSVKNTTGMYKTLSIGRIQGPTLSFVQEREIEIESFVPQPYWEIKAETYLDRRKIPLEYEKPRLETPREAVEIVEACTGKDGIVTAVRTRTLNVAPTPNFNLGDLQREAYAKFRYSPTTTKKAAERLYLEALISYPRTSSQRLPPTIDLREILRGLRRMKEYKKHSDGLLAKPQLIPRQGKMDDPAHPAIHPTGKGNVRMSKIDSKVFDLVCRRFMASLGAPAVKENTGVEVDVSGYKFHLRGIVTCDEGWMRLYEPYVRRKDVPLPKIRRKQIMPVTNIEAVEQSTRPPSRFNPSSLLKRMEDEGIGTKATRTDVIDTLYRRGYIEGNPIELTDLGHTTADVLNRYNPEILSVEMTRRLDQDLESIQRGEASADGVIAKAVQFLDRSLSEFKANEGLIGAEIGEVLRVEMQKATVLGQCPKCGTGEIRIVLNKQTGKRFAGCSNYYRKSCSVSYPLPQIGSLKFMGRSCSTCGAPIVRLTRRNRRPWEFCINMDCPTKNA